MIALMREGYDRPPAFRDLIDALQTSNVIALVRPAVCAGGRIRSCVTSVNGSDRERHIRINVDTLTSHNRLIATIAHELQHAVEIAERSDVVDGAQHATSVSGRLRWDDVAKVFRTSCETASAGRLRKVVLAELFGREPRRAEATAREASRPELTARVDAGCAGQRGEPTYARRSRSQ